VGIIHRYRTALTRKRRSQGFGIHSPFAYALVTEVLHQRNPYYAYADLDDVRDAIREVVERPHPRIISTKGMRMLFRITNRFNPSCILEIGTCYGLPAAAMMSVSSHSHLYLVEPHLEQHPLVVEVLRPVLDRLDVYDRLSVALPDYLAALQSTTEQDTPEKPVDAPQRDATEKLVGSEQRDAAEVPFILINDIPSDLDADALTAFLDEQMRSTAIIILRNISRRPAMKQLWHHCHTTLQSGQSFTNEKTALIIATPRLPLQHFLLWF